MKITAIYLVVFCTIVSAINALDDYHPELEPVSELPNKNERDPKYWIDQAQLKLKEKIKVVPNTSTAKNIILFVGDGMGIQTVTATRAFIKDASYRLSFEQFPYFGLTKTYCVDNQVADSACAATAYLTGVKANLGTTGVNAKVKYNNCKQSSDKKNHVNGIAKWAQDAKKATGIVTTTRVTHATPSGIYAHSSNRYWECDSWIEWANCSSKTNKDIAQQLIDSEVGKKLNVILGGGRSMFLDKNVNDDEGVAGLRSDGRNLINEWLEDREKHGIAEYIWNRKKLFEVNLSKTDYLLGLFSPDHCPYNGDRKRIGLEKSDPSLSEMTEKALKILKKEKNGYFLFVEGGRIDTAHHATLARKALEETEEFAKAIELARNSTEEKDTLILVIGDHSHVMTTNGYPDRGSNILGMSTSKKDMNKQPFTVISYANGPGHYKAYPKNSKGRRDISHDDFSDAEYQYPSGVPLDSATHGGEDVGVFASGPQAHLFVGNYEQSYIPMLIAHVAKIGPYSQKNIQN